MRKFGGNLCMRKSIFGCHRGLIDLGMWVSKLFSVLVFPMLSYLRHSHSQSMFAPEANQRPIPKPISDRFASQSAIESKRPIRVRLGANFVGGRVFWECAVVFPLTSFLVSGHSQPGTTYQPRKWWVRRNIQK